ncbi:MAG TPA: AAA family ATPase [Puia sp.]|nr:AAA family ATPase [Puia sp.]
MDLGYLFRVLLKRKWIIIGSSVLAALAAYIITRNEPKHYLSSTRVSTGFSVPDEIKVNDANSGSVWDVDIRFNNAINTWTSPSVVSLLSYELILHDLTSPDPFRRLSPAQRQSSTYRSVDLDMAQKVFQEKLASMTVLTSFKPDEKALLEFLDLYGYGYRYLIQYFRIYQVPRTDYIQVDCTTENPVLSAFIVNNLFKDFIRYYGTMRSSKSQESVDTLENIMEKKKQEWEQKNQQLRSEGLVDASSENSSKLDIITELQKSLTDEKSKQTDDYFMLQRINQRLNGTGTSSTGATPDVTNNEELIQARSAMNAAYSQYLKTNDSGQLAKYNQLKTEYDRKYAQLAPAQGANKVPENRNDLLERKNDIQVQIEASNAKVKDIQSQINTLRASISSTSSKGANTESLMEEAKMAEKEYFDAKERYNNAFDIVASSTNNFRQLQIAQPALEPEPSKRMIIVGMAGALTFLSASLIILMVTYLDSSVRTPAIFSRIVRLKLISIVNMMNLRHKTLQNIVAGTVREVDSTEKRRNNVFRESIRKLRYEIEKSGKKIFLFTSTKKGQGKTTLILALSYSLSMSKKKILIIDTNFCNNDLTVNLEADRVLEQISTSNGKSIVDQIKFFAKDIGTGNVFIIGAEGGDYTPSEILPTENILIHLHELTKEYDYIFLEGPPLNDFSDSRELVTYVDGVVAIFSATSSIKQIDKESMEFFRDLNGKFCGSVLNKIDMENVNAL